RDRLQAFGGERQCKGGHEIGGARTRQRIDEPVGVRVKLRDPVRLDGPGRDGREENATLRHVRGAVLAHHVVAHEPGHQAFRLIGAEDVDLLFGNGNVVAVAQKRAAELGYEGDRRLVAQPGERGIGVVPECGDVDIDVGSVAQGLGLSVAATLPAVVRPWKRWRGRLAAPPERSPRPHLALLDRMSLGAYGHRCRAGSPGRQPLFGGRAATGAEDERVLTMNREERGLREAIIAQCRWMNACGLNQGTSGNISARHSGEMLITPSAVPYEAMKPEMIASMPLEGEYGAWEGPLKPSTEWRFHLDIMRARSDVGAIVHTHSTYATVLAIARKSIPACHYMMAAFGGTNIRCAGYARYGTKELSEHALAALEGRNGCLLANHGMIAVGANLDKAMWLAVELET